MSREDRAFQLTMQAIEFKPGDIYTTGVQDDERSSAIKLATAICEVYNYLLANLSSADLEAAE